MGRAEIGQQEKSMVSMGRIGSAPVPAICAELNSCSCLQPISPCTYLYIQIYIHTYIHTLFACRLSSGPLHLLAPVYFIKPLFFCKVLPIPILFWYSWGLISEFLWNLVKFIFNLIFSIQNYSKFNNFCSIGSKIAKQQTCIPPHRGRSTIPKAEQGVSPTIWEGYPPFKKGKAPRPPITLEKFYRFLYIGAKHASTNSLLCTF